jgi:hypothetical protein
MPHATNEPTVCTVRPRRYRLVGHLLSLCCKRGYRSDELVSGGVMSGVIEYLPADCRAVVSAQKWSVGHRGPHPEGIVAPQCPHVAEETSSRGATASCRRVHARAAGVGSRRNRSHHRLGVSALPPLSGTELLSARPSREG